MKAQKQNLMMAVIVLLLAIGLALAVTGVIFIDDRSDKTGGMSLEEIHDFDQEEMGLREMQSSVYGSIFVISAKAAANDTSPAAEKGITVGELMRYTGIFAVLLAIAILLYIEFFRRSQVSMLNYRVLLIIALLVLPALVTLSASTTVLETTKTVESCASCHVMDVFVEDLYDPHSSTLAARHYKNKWISEFQCYTCHTTYGAHGTFEGKRDGFRHWLLFVTRTWEEPISYSGSYPNINCTSCHGGTQKYLDVPSHVALAEKLSRDEVSCTSCHGPAHPVPKERDREEMAEQHALARYMLNLAYDNRTQLLESPVDEESAINQYGGGDE